MSRRFRSRWIATILAISVLGALALWLRRADLTDPPRFLPRCLLNDATGLYCPGCGNTRAAHALMHGDLMEALRQNAYTIIALPFLAIAACRSWWAWVMPGPIQESKWRWKQSYTLIAVWSLAAFTLLRNLPWEPFRWLAPDPPKVRATPESEAPARLSRDAPPPSAR